MTRLMLRRSFCLVCGPAAARPWRLGTGACAAVDHPAGARADLGRGARVAAAAAAADACRGRAAARGCRARQRRRSSRWRRSANRSKAAPSTSSGPARVRFRCCCGRRCMATSRPRPRRCSTCSSTCGGIGDDPPVRGILSSLTLHFVPMLNPDGAERFQRRNAQGIDINRDALRLQTPEGRALKAVRDRAAAARRLQPAQPGLAHVGRRAAEAGVDLAAVGGVRRGALGQRRTQAHEEDLRGDPRRARAVRVGADRPLRRRVRGAGVRRQPHAVGHAGGADRDRPVARRRARSGARAAELRRHRVRARCAGHRRRRTRRPEALRDRCR